MSQVRVLVVRKPCDLPGVQKCRCRLILGIVFETEARLRGVRRHSERDDISLPRPARRNLFWR